MASLVCFQAVGCSAPEPPAPASKSSSPANSARPASLRHHLGLSAVMSGPACGPLARCGWLYWPGESCAAKVLEVGLAAQPRLCQLGLPAQVGDPPICAVEASRWVLGRIRLPRSWRGVMELVPAPSGPALDRPTFRGAVCLLNVRYLARLEAFASASLLQLCSAVVVKSFTMPMASRPCSRLASEHRRPLPLPSSLISTPFGAPDPDSGFSGADPAGGNSRPTCSC